LTKQQIGVSKRDFPNADRESDIEVSFEINVE